MTISGKPKLFVTRKLTQDVEDRIAGAYEPVFNDDDHIMGPSELAEKAQGCDGALVTTTERIDRSFIETLPDSLKIVATFSVGYDHIDVPAAEARGITVTNTPDVLTDATADTALLLMLGAARGAVWGERMVREATWTSWSPTHPLGHDMTGRKLAILGMGRIGQAVAKRARGFDMEIHYHKRTRLPAELEQGAVYHDTHEGLFANGEFLSINCASTPETRGLINTETIAMLPDGAVLVNTARGDIVDDDALIAAIESGKLAAAGLDVFAGEPAIDERYRTLKNTFLLPHIGSATAGTRSAMGLRAVDNLDAFFAGNTPGDLVTAG
ncbi:MAG: D-glycerate dehydrogenase [Pseudomonadota bacterium]